MIEHPHGHFALFVGHVENGLRPHPFEVWVNGSEQPRGLGAVAKTLSMDMRADDPAWLRLKLDTLAKTLGDDAFDMPFPPHGETQAYAQRHLRRGATGPLALRAPGRAAGGEKRRRCSTPCSA